MYLLGIRESKNILLSAFKTNSQHNVVLPAQADIPMVYDPSDAIQIDWGEATAYIDDVKTKINF